MVSSSESRSSGSVPATVSSPLVKPSSSRSQAATAVLGTQASAGSASSPSLTPSSSESASSGLVPVSSSSALVSPSPSPSQLPAASFGSHGSSGSLPPS